MTASRCHDDYTRNNDNNNNNIESFDSFTLSWRLHTQQRRQQQQQQQQQQHRELWKLHIVVTTTHTQQQQQRQQHRELWQLHVVLTTTHATTTTTTTQRALKTSHCRDDYTRNNNNNNNNRSLTTTQTFYNWALHGGNSRNGSRVCRLLNFCGNFPQKWKEMLLDSRRISKIMHKSCKQMNEGAFYCNVATAVPVAAKIIHQRQLAVQDIIIIISVC